MRRWFFVFLILLLPLRGWVGDAMAMQMALPGQHALVCGAMPHADSDAEPAHLPSSAVASEAATAGDCGGHPGAQDRGDEADAAHCEASAMCQTCHTVAVLLLPDLLAIAQASLLSPSAPMPVFASADRALSLKPPIC